METKLLKNALFGFSKTSVCEYIATANEEFSKKMLLALDEHEKEKAALNEKIALLEAELEEFRKAQSDISAALLDAQRYAAQLRQQADEEDQRVRTEQAEQRAAQILRLESYKSSIDELRRDLSVFADSADHKLEAFLKKAHQLEQDGLIAEPSEEDTAI